MQQKNWENERRDNDLQRRYHRSFCLGSQNSEYRTAILSLFTFQRVKSLEELQSFPYLRFRKNKTKIRMNKKDKDDTFES